MLLLNKKYTKQSFIFLFILFSFQLLNSCIFVKMKEKTEEHISVDVIQKPEIPMNDEILRSAKGDMISLIPKNWFFVDLAEDTPKDVFAIAVNPSYTLSFIFSGYPTNELYDGIYKEQKLIGLANASFDRKQKKAGGSLIKANKIYNFNSGNLEFVVFRYRTKTQPMNSVNAIFKSSIGNIYEISLVPMNLSGISLPTEDEMNRIFNSILSTVKY